MKLAILICGLLPCVALANFPDDGGINDSKLYPNYGHLPPITEKHKSQTQVPIASDQQRINQLNNSQINKLGYVCGNLTVVQCMKQKPEAVKTILSN